MVKTILALLLGAFAVIAQGPGDRILGVWVTPNGESKIEIAKCGEAYCGSIKSMAKPMNDLHNPDAALRSRPLVGVQILKGFKYSAPDTWTDGTLYGPERGKEVSPKIVLSGQNSLDIKVSAGMVKKTVTWTRER